MGSIIIFLRSAFLLAKAARVAFESYMLRVDEVAIRAASSGAMVDRGPGGSTVEDSGAADNRAVYPILDDDFDHDKGSIVNATLAHIHYQRFIRRSLV